MTENEIRIYIHYLQQWLKEGNPEEEFYKGHPLTIAKINDIRHEIELWVSVLRAMGKKAPESLRLAGFDLPEDLKSRMAMLNDARNRAKVQKELGGVLNYLRNNPVER